MKIFNMYVKTIVENDDGKILLLKENRMDKKPRWDLPSAILTDDISFDEAVVNNVQKEIGYYVYPGKIIGVSHYTNHDIKEIHVIMTGTILSGEPLLSNNYDDYTWIPLKRITEYPLKDWLNHYIKHTDEPFNDVTREIEELESLEDTRKEISNDNFFSSHAKSSKSHDIIEDKTANSNKSSFSMLKDAIRRTFHPKKAEITHTEPKMNLYSPEQEPEQTDSSIAEKLNIKPNPTEEIIKTEEKEEENAAEIEDIPVDEELLLKIKNQKDEIVVEHDENKNITTDTENLQENMDIEEIITTDNEFDDDIETVIIDDNDTVDTVVIDTTPQKDTIAQEIKPKTEKVEPEKTIEKTKPQQTKPIVPKVEQSKIENKILKDEIKPEKQEKTPEIESKPKKLFNMNVNHENNMKRTTIKKEPTKTEYVKKEAPKVDKQQNIKVIHNNEKTPYIRKEKESSQKISFNSEGIKRHGWKETLNELNRTEANNEKKTIPHPKGIRRK